jgi:hypothetical protein
MDTLLMIVGGLAGAGVGFGGGMLLGRRVHARPGWVYWLLNIAALAIGVAVAAVGILQSAVWLFVAAAAFMGGAFTGLKYGYEKVIPPWEITKVGAEEREKH